MGKIYLSSNDIEKIKQGEFLGSGDYADVYAYKEEAIKIYKQNINKIDLKRIERISEYKNDSFVFPKDIVYVDDNARAYTQERVIGITLYEMIIAVLKGFYDIDIALLSEDYLKLKMSIKEISDEHIIVNRDLHNENVMFSNGFKVVDTGNYIVDLFRNKDELFKSNLIRFIDLLVAEFLNLNNDLTRYIQQEIGKGYNVNYMDDFFEIIDKKTRYCKTLRDFKDYDFY